MTASEFFYDLTAVIETCMFFMMFDTFLEKRKVFTIWQYMIGIVILAIMIIIVNKYLMYQVGNACGMILSAIVVSMYFYCSSCKKRIFISLSVWLIMAVIEILVMNIISLIFGLSANEATNIFIFFILGIILSKSIAFAVCYAIRVKTQFDQFELSRTYWILFVLLFSSSVVAFFLILGLMNAVNDPKYNAMATVGTIGLFAGNFFTLYFYERMAKQNKVIYNQEQAENQMRLQLKYLNEIILKQNELRSMKHDIKGHFIALNGYFDDGNIQGGKKYISGLIDQIQNTTSTIQTGNTPLDSILSAKKSLAASKGIIFNTNIHIQKELPIDPKDLCIIFGNALDNAIEACDRLPESSNKTISLTFVQDIHSIYCKIVNSALPCLDRQFLTSKTDKENHGFGLHNIREALNNYQSTLTVTQEDNFFILSFAVFY